MLSAQFCVIFNLKKYIIQLIYFSLYVLFK